ncbi:MAG: hypothetical protein WC958_03425 [Dehalococcoidales bacterium]
MNKNILNIIMIGCFVLITFGFMFVNVFKPNADFSFAERRKLLSAPQFSGTTLLNGKYFDDYEKYFLDQFIFRDNFRGFTAFTKLFLLNQQDYNDIYAVDGNICKIEYPLSEKAILNAAQKLNQVYDLYLQGLNVNYAVIPDKNYFMGPSYGAPTMDYGKLLDILQSDIRNIQYIDLFSGLSINDYYKTDIHWSQDKIIGVADILMAGIGNSILPSDFGYTIKELAPFYGSLHGQAALNLPAETLFYLTNAMLEEAVVFDYETMKKSSIYVTDLFEGIDPYDVFLSGAKALLTIENPNATTDKELILFRDSFGSSIAPLLACGYSKITLVDLRYITTDLLGNYIDFSAADDVLFLYSTQILNNSFMLR